MNHIENVESKTEKIVGVLGGMGPDATVDLMARVLAATPASDDIDHIHMIVDNNPKVPSRIKAIIEGSGPSPAPELAKMSKRLVAAGADILVMPCNTAHYYYDDIKAAVDIPVINLIDLVVETVITKQPNVKSIGMLASTAVKITNLYHPRFEIKEVAAHFPHDVGQNAIMNVIKRVKRNGVRDQDIEQFNQQVSALEKCGVECFVVACTELSVIAKHLSTHLPFFDASQILAEEVVRLVKDI